VKRTTTDTSSRALPAALVLTGAVSVQAGAGIASRLFTLVSPAAVTAVRLWAAAAILLLVAGKPTFRALATLVREKSWRAGSSAGAFGVALAVMNFAIYQSFARIPLGVAVTVEFLGPLAVAVAGARRLTAVGWAVLAGGGVALLGYGSGGHLNLAGVAWGLVSAAGWAGYIVLSRASGQQMPGSSGLVIAMCVAAILVTGPGVAAGGTGLFTPRVLLTGAAVGLLSSVIPYGLEFQALRRIRPRIFGVWMSLQPAVAAVVGLVVLGQRLGLEEWLGICCVVIASGGAAARRSND
jgi:inner membrane transporter RhtA